MNRRSSAAAPHKDADRYDADDNRTRDGNALRSDSTKLIGEDAGDRAASALQHGRRCGLSLELVNRGQKIRARLFDLRL